jgi:hypothetical protein
MGHGNDMNSIVVMPENNLKRELLHVARPVPRFDSNEPFGIGLNVRKRYIDGNAEFTSGSGTVLSIPISGCLQLSRRFGMKTNSHRQHRAS